MIVKSPSKRVSQLNLKFLDIRFLQVNQNNLTAPLPRINQLPQDDNTILKKYNHKRKESLQNSKYSQVKGAKQSSLNQQNTADITGLNYNTSFLQNNSKCDRNTDNLLKYLTVDANSMYREFESRTLTKTKRKLKQQHQFQKDTIQNALKIKQYEEGISNLQKQTSMIHHQIIRMYAQQLNKNFPVKSVSNMKLTQNLRFNTQYQSANKHRKNKKLEIFHNSINKNIKMYKNEHLDEKESKKARVSLEKLNFKRKKQENNRNKIQKISLPTLKNKYQNFYQDLYKQDKIPNSLNQIDEKNMIINVIEAKKKLISNNYDKNFEAFLMQKKLRVPRILQKLR